MKLDTLLRIALGTALVIGTPNVSLAQSKTAQVCFSDTAVDPIGAGLLPILVQTDQLIAVEMLDGASAQYVYLLTRQMVLTERILRRLLGRGSDCEAIANNITNAYHGCLWFKPLKSSISSASKPRRANSIIIPKASVAISA